MCPGKAASILAHSRLVKSPRPTAAAPSRQARVSKWETRPLKPNGQMVMLGTLRHRDPTRNDGRESQKRAQRHRGSVGRLSSARVPFAKRQASFHPLAPLQCFVLLNVCARVCSHDDTSLYGNSTVTAFALHSIWRLH